MLPDANTGFPIEAMVLGNAARFIRPLTLKKVYITGPRISLVSLPGEGWGRNHSLLQPDHKQHINLTLDGKLLFRGFSKVSAKESINLPFSSFTLIIY